MRRFLRRLFLFLLPLLAGFVCIFQLPVERNYVYHYNPGDCENRGAWMYERIFRDTTPVDIAFLGSSHTMTSINEMQVESLLLAQSGKRYHAANFGYCRNGEDLPVLFLEDLLCAKKPRLVVVEVRERISTNSHPLYPYYAPARELLDPPSFSQPAYFSNVYNGWLLRLAAFRNRLIPPADTVSFPGYSSYGFRFSDHTEELEELERAKASKLQPGPPTLFRRQLLRYPLAWMERMEQLARDHGAKICFVYMPSYGSPEKEPELKQFHEGNYLLPPDSILTRENFWRDPDHMNNAGAKAFSEWLAGRLAESL